eukprot:gb/GECG01001758.1/.p1 GENE.gb/GECG01001758.1/~~gb/GECG01001758.1/.p1  ORF type:complete len:174 (+),score=13.38 gb/GECG01001758.1/:1-522(+)
MCFRIIRLVKSPRVFPNRHLSLRVLWRRTQVSRAQPGCFPSAVYLSTNSLRKSSTEYVDPTSVLRDEDLHEQFVMGSGRGGQKVNTTRNNVVLKHHPTNIVVSCHQTRSLEQNRKIARRKLLERLDVYYNGTNSKLEQKIRKVQKNKAKKRKRAMQKHNSEGKLPAGESNKAP